MEFCAAESRSRLLLIAGVLVCLAALSILAIDVPVAIALSGAPEAVQLTTSRFTGVVEVVFGFPLSIYASGLAVLALSGALALQSVARVIANDHYVSDVLASAAVAALVTLAYCGHLTAGRVDRPE
jgi:hypothetical protein